MLEALRPLTITAFALTLLYLPSAPSAQEGYPADVAYFRDIDLDGVSLRIREAVPTLKTVILVSKCDVAVWGRAL